MMAVGDFTQIRNSRNSTTKKQTLNANYTDHTRDNLRQSQGQQSSSRSSGLGMYEHTTVYH